jgi:hypothetical protein
MAEVVALGGIQMSLDALDSVYPDDGASEDLSPGSPESLLRDWHRSCRTEPALS